MKKLITNKDIHRISNKSEEAIKTIRAELAKGERANSNKLFKLISGTKYTTRISDNCIKF